ncbi:MAG TPA: tetratricopeptide repeat protein [Steroidobacteraceae bacterium]|nr:tetratricopeptide repeat protein [Steroidobacteraceae bacterium]
MPFFIISILLDVIMVIHVVKTGRSTTWIWVMVMLPIAGPIAYLIMEVLPDFSRSRTARRVISGAKRTINPDADLHKAHRRLRLNDSIDSRRQVADELCNAGKYDEAIDYYRQALTGLYEHDPHLLLGLATAQFQLGRAVETRETLDRLIKENPEFKSPDGHLLYARALEAEGNVTKARNEYETLAKYYPGAEAKYRYAALLKKIGETDKSRAVLSQMLNDAELSTKHFRKSQKEWLLLAKRDFENW